MQGTCDKRGRFLDVSINHPGATSDYLAFITSELHHKLDQPGFLAPGLALFGDNAYVNSHFMVTPFKNVSEGPKDAYNFFQSQLHIRVECGFGMSPQCFATDCSGQPTTETSSKRLVR